ncbi:hypothetical protein BFW01_g10483 [Lasiodiplodia theobromae]|uniref:Gpi-anchored cell surface glycoprotein n=1 Tax=Lasiodiplodia theobromae TaxID=45133 RepID=A0A5N5DF23_9PEZI|nr:Gpi-anchored cell surface glycoprotein [Lasiodiplodia theobromae]KAB2576453.1 hypothetical protein DBV05_g4907 [Lasiodiplodia theobromae]KAF4543945.1 Gpi-anchored cell surface glycoprotein [Lasiodiplodia theobromae]KAF9629280.1 hypothetical protein BFW01_g10483 [Lasiodiplodia theobromae]
MSLNGLDDAPVTEAYQSALTEAGGWFLLKYASRDAVEIFNFGSGGLSEARAALLDYDEKSPLYGFLLFRRRKVLLKYVPQGTSRLLQARVTVHFTEIEEKFTPHDSVFSFTTPQELSDHALSAANSLHTAAPSTSASSTSSKKKLDGIDEDAEEGQGTSGKGEGAALERTETVASAAKVEAAPDTASIRSRPFSPTGYEERRPETPGTSGGDASSVIASPRGYAQSVRSFKSLNHFDHQHYDDPNRRSSSQTARADLDFSYLYKPKVKLGPRPTQEPHSHAAESKSAKLPASLKAAVRSKGSSSRPKSRDSSTVPSSGFPPPPPVPTILEMPATTPARPTSSTGAKSSSNSVKSPGITPEKQRLKRAVELRKKQKAAQLARQKSSEKHDPDATAGAEDKEDSAGEKAPEAEGDDIASHRETTSSTDSGSTLKPDEALGTPDHTKADSGVQLMISGAGDEEDARPPTPVASSPISVQESSNPSSTRPSSISDGGEHKEELDADEQAEVALPHDGAAETSLGLPSAAEPAPARASGAEHPNRDVSSSPDRGATGEHQTAAAKGPESSEDFTTALPSSSSLPERRSTTKSKRRVPVDPIRVEPGAESSDDDCDYLSDDSLMEELQSATVEEAKPMSVSKSPIMSIFPRRRSQTSTQSTTSTEHRVNSNPLSMCRTVTPTRLSPSPESQLGVGQRSFSASYASEAQHEAPLVKKSNVSSGISQRIKALAEKSAKEGTPVTLPKVGYTPERGAISIAQRSNSFRVSHASNAEKQLRRLSKSSFISVPPLERPASKGENSSDSIQAVYNKDANNKTESVTVTARIVRSPQTPGQELEDSPLDLQPSPISVDHQKADEAAAPPSIVIPPAVEEATLSPTSGDVSPAQQSNAHLESPAQALPRSSSESSWRSFGRRRSEATSPPPMSRSQSVISLDSVATEEGEEKKKGNRASRLLKRMSNSLTSSKKSLNQMMSYAVQEEAPQPIEEAKESQPGIEIGDLNVQFPDTLLWKRRWVEIDVQGNIVLTLSKANEQSKGITKRYHLSEFSAPFAPDQEREEMPNSVMLDFHDGRTLQCACESAPGQTRVLSLLREAHKSWSR